MERVAAAPRRRPWHRMVEKKDKILWRLRGCSQQDCYPQYRRLPFNKDGIVCVDACVAIQPCCFRLVAKSFIPGGRKRKPRGDLYEITRLLGPRSREEIRRDVAVT